ncbi:MAG TPA: ABC transporter ATP-binding protein [Candidatus Binatia bacterium]
MSPAAAAERIEAAGVPSICLRALRKRFGSREALSGIDLDVRGAQMLGVVGPDGAGKTTLLRVLAGLLEIEADEARVLGFDLLQDVQQYKRHIGYVPQTFSLYRDLSILENLSFTARLHRIDDAEFERRTSELLERTSLAPFATRMAGALSGGMKQKLAVANALLPHPSLLILDEPTAGVDVVARREIFEILAELESSVLVVVSTSYLEEAALCDHLVYLRRGRVIAQGSPLELEAATGTEPYRAWTDDCETVRNAVRALPWVDGARDCGRFVRVEVERDKSPGAEAVCRALADVRGADGTTAVALAERAPADLESTLLALGRRAGVA